MANLINTALTQGFTAKQVLDFITKKYPKYAKQVNKAITSGFSVDQIMSFITGGKVGLNKQASQGGTEFEQTRDRDIQNRSKLNKNAIATGTAIAGGLAAPTAIATLQRAVPSTLRTMVPTLLGQQIQQPPTPPIGQSPPLHPQAPATNLPPQPPVNTNVIPNIPQPPVINNNEIINKIKELASIGKSPADIVELFKQKSPEEISRIEKETGKKFEDFIKESLIDPAEQARRKALETFKGKERERVDQAYPEYAEEQKSPKIEKSSVVATPQGVGEVLEIRNGKALIEVDGKKHQVDEDELIQSPLPQKDLADLFDDLIGGIEKETEEDVSRMVNFSGYDPNTNSLAFLPYDGALYIYDDLNEEEKATAMNLMAKRKTSGENHIGAWTKDTKSPAGAAMSAFIKKLQESRGGKGNEYQRKYATVYSAFEPAIKASKEKKKKKKKKKS